MLILKSQKVPHKTSDYFAKTDNRYAIVWGNNFLIDQDKLQNPNESQQWIFHNNKVVEPLKNIIWLYLYKLN